MDATFSSEDFRAAAERADKAGYVDLSVEAGRALIPSLDASAMRLSLTLLQTAEMVKYDLDAGALRGGPFTNSSFHLAFVIALAGSIEGAAIPTITGMSRASVSAMLKTLEKNGIVSKQTSVSNGRTNLIAITALGRAAVLDSWTKVNRRESEWAARLTGEEIHLLADLLTKLGTFPGAISRSG